MYPVFLIISSVAVPFLVFNCIINIANGSYGFPCFAPYTLLLSALAGFYQLFFSLNISLVQCQLTSVSHNKAIF